MHVSFRNGFYAGLIITVAVGLYLLRLWQPQRQVHLHSINLLEAIQEKDWPDVEVFIAGAYQDDWGHDRASLLRRMREVLRYARDLRLNPGEPTVTMDADAARWSGRITAQGEGGEVTALIKERVNALPDPFELTWRRQSRKPWDWKLERASNRALELPL